MLSGLGLSEILIILLVTLVVIGPEKIPDVARMLGKGVREVRRASNTFRDMFMLEEGANYDQKKQNASPKDRPKVGQASRGAGVSGTVTRRSARPPTRPVRLEPARSSTHVSEAVVASADATDHCRFEPIAAPRAQ
ncbi:MAG: Sec-independent protein translocase subunit TatA/TatB [Persicimonas sp.]